MLYCDTIIKIFGCKVKTKKTNDGLELFGEKCKWKKLKNWPPGRNKPKKPKKPKKDKDSTSEIYIDATSNIKIKKPKKDKDSTSEVKIKMKLSDRPLEYRRDPKDERDYTLPSKYKNFSLVVARAPAGIDHTNEMGSVKDQGMLGSCVGFAVTAMKEWQELKEHKEEIAEEKRDHRERKEYDLSESWVYWNSKKIDAWPNEEGTSIRYAMKVLNRIGVPTEKAWPYSDTNIGKPKSWATMIAKWAWIGDYWSIDNLTELKAAIAKNPVPIGIACFEEIFYPDQNGLVAYPANPDNFYGGHAVCAVGYDDTKKLIKFKNSWGESWGENGYGYLSYDYITDYMWDAWTSDDIRVRKSMLKETKKLVD